MRKMVMILLMLNFGWITLTLGAGVGTAWDVSPDQSTEYTTHSSWPRVNLSAFEVRSISGVGRFHSQSNNPEKASRNSGESNIKREAKEVEDMETDYVPEILFDHPVFKGIFKKPKQHPDVEMLAGPWEKSTRQDRTGRNGETCPESLEEDAQSEGVIGERPRVRREIEEAQLAKMKNAREPRLSTPDLWSKQPLSIDSPPSPMSEHQQQQQAPHTEFVTASRRAFSEIREPRDLPMTRSFNDLPYRNSFRERDLEMSYPRGYYYPDDFRTERDYLIRGVNNAVLSPDRYRIEDYDMYRNRPTPKPKRIIYYATLPEIVRKPIDLRRPYDFRAYDNMGRTTVSPTSMRDPMYKRLSGMMDTKYGYRSYPYGYDSYDPYIKRSGYWDRPYMPYDRLDEDRYREQDLDHASFKETPRGSNDGSIKFDNSVEGRSQEKLPWPVQIGTQLNVKDNERVSGRKIFGHHSDYERLRQSARIPEREINEGIPEAEKRD